MKIQIALVALAFIACSDNPHRQYDVPVNFVDTSFKPKPDTVEKDTELAEHKYIIDQFKNNQTFTIDASDTTETLERISKRKGVQDPGLVQYVTYTNISYKRLKIK